MAIDSLLTKQDRVMRRNIDEGHHTREIERMAIVGERKGINVDI